MTDSFPVITRESFARPVDWPYFTDAIADGHRLPKAELADVFLGPPDRTLLSRAARIEGLGFAVKTVTAMAGNPAKGLPYLHGAMTVFDDATGQVRAVIDSGLVTNIKTVADSLLGARLLARPDSRSLLVVGAGSVAENLVRGYAESFPALATIAIWNRTGAKAEALAAACQVPGVEVRAVHDLAAALREAEIVASATMASDPVIDGSLIRPGTHVDLIGAFRADMREADDTLLRRGLLTVDSRETTIGHIGELKIPLEAGTITEADIRGDLYDLVAGPPFRQDDAEITVFKNGGGAHLDLMTADAILRLVQQA